VTWIIFWNCAAVCDPLADRPAWVECPFDVCKEDLKQTRQMSEMIEAHKGKGKKG
jgi:hypothetical protein